MRSAIALPVLEQRLADPAGHRRDGLRDPLGRGIGYLRLSLTGACSMRCTYCRPETYNNPRDEDRLSPIEIQQVVDHLASRHGLSKVRLTGGDPTSRPELVQIIKRVASVPGINDLAMTTNGLTLERMAKRYRDAGLKRVNISLDTLHPARFARLTGVDGLPSVLRGIDAALGAGLGPVKLNTVVVRGQNEDDLVELVYFAADRGVEIRFIELMAMGPLAEQWHERYVPEPDIRARLLRGMTFTDTLEQGHDSARRCRAVLHNGRRVTVGFITPMSCNFCGGCNRLRLAADGRVYPCLMDKPAGSVLPAVRPQFNHKLLDRCLHNALLQKQAEHPHFGNAIMTTIGG